VTGREPDDLAAGEREPVGGAGFRLFGSVPISGVIRCGQCRWLQSSLRVAPAVAGGHGAVRVRGGGLGGVNQVGARAARVGAAGRQLSDLAPGRWPPNAVHAALTGGWPGAWVRQRICPSRMP
jgi:hypothetical protein